MGGNLLNGKVTESQQLLGVGDPQLDQILVDGYAVLSDKNFAQVELIDVKLLTEKIQRDFLCVIAIQKRFDLL